MAGVSSGRPSSLSVGIIGVDVDSGMNAGASGFKVEGAGGREERREATCPVMEIGALARRTLGNRLR
jgi:hypothetical protein